MMKKLAVAVLIASIAATATVATAGILPRTGINGSKHDINSIVAYQDDIYKRTCVFCHTPHNAQVDPLGLDPAPLWNRAPSTLNLTPYTWVSPANAASDPLDPAVAMIPFNADPLIGPSRLCMSCHDGSIAVDSHLAAGAAAGTIMMSGAPLITDLAITHPIGFLYSDALALRGTTELMPIDTGFIEGSIPTNGTFDTNNRSLALSPKTIKDTLYGGGYMTCASCHDVHNTVNAVPDAAPATQYNYFLYAKQEGSSICLSCHVK